MYNLFFRINKNLGAALLLGLAFNASAMFYTLDYTYDALIHLFFGEHYANNWFESWNYKWYTGFTVTSYPPLVHQLIALLSFIGGLKFGMFLLTTVIITLFITGVYRYSLLFTTNKDIAGLAALLSVFASSFLETLHVFGQLPSLMGISLLMHAMPEIYNWLYYGKLKFLLRAVSLIAVTVSSHHVTPIFGMVFFIFPLMGTVVLDYAKQNCNSYKDITIILFIKTLFSLLKRKLIFGFSVLFLIVFCILPYWINSKNNPITQVPIPHGSRDNFLEITSSGLVFFFIPWGALLLILPYFFIRFFHKRNLFFGLSFTMLTLLGTGGTTPLPKMLLGENAFNILTLDRFTLWATIMCLPLFGEFTYRFFKGDLKTYFIEKFGKTYYFIIGFSLNTFFFAMIVFTMTLGLFRPSQPQKIEMLPIINFLNQDQHYKWRYLTLGFGDQMAWLSANTKALSVDGNYHSARRLPELTSRPIERLENSKFKGVAGIGSLQQFLTVPEKYNLKYIFSNDKFYDPILYFCGWQKLAPLENGISVWEKIGIPPLDGVLPKDDIPRFIEIIWGIIPISTIVIAILLFVITASKSKKEKTQTFGKELITLKIDKEKKLKKYYITHYWMYFVLILVSFFIYRYYLYTAAHKTPDNLLRAYYDAIDFKNFETAFSYLNPDDKISIDQFMLEIAVNDGILSSYAKLDEIKTSLISKNNTSAIYKVSTKWITPLEEINKEEIKQLVYTKNKWYLVKDDLETDLPPNQLIENNSPKYFNQGRRKVSTEQTYHEDVLRQPIIEIISAKLIKQDSNYIVLGELQNIDNIPTDVNITVSLYDKNSKELATFNAKYFIKHKLMPKETTNFRVDFERVAWSKNNDVIPSTFNPNQFTPIELNSTPVSFVIQASSNVTTINQYKDLFITSYEVNNQKLNGTVFNSGIQEVTIPQLLISYYSANKELIWITSKTILNSVRPERKVDFEIELPSPKNIQLISNNMDKCFINGLPNKSLASKIVFKRNTDLMNINLIPVNYNSTKGFVKIEPNNYVGNFK